jgi:hypothetical protein
MTAGCFMLGLVFVVTVLLHIAGMPMAPAMFVATMLVMLGGLLLAAWDEKEQ